MKGSCLLIAAISLVGNLPNLSLSTLPIIVSPKTTQDQCSELSAEKEDISQAVSETIATQVNSALNSKYGRACDCRGEGWTQVVNINMTDPTHQCPSNWTFYNSNGIRGCRRQSDSGCDSAVFAIHQSYSRACGKINAYQLGDPDAFDNIFRGYHSIEQSYVDGVSLTYGAPGSRKHIWTFVSADNFTGFHSSETCRCTFKNYPWYFQLPPFLGTNYFCELGRNSHDLDLSTPYPNLLWDGTGCTDPDTCCEFNDPPWFCVSLPEPTSEAIEARLCLNDSPSNEDMIITLVDIYVQ